MSIIESLYEYIKETRDTLVLRYGKTHPMWLANYYYKQNFHRNIDWDNPTEFNEKIRWMQFYTDTSLWSLLADKYEVRQYLKEKGYENLLSKLYGVWKSANEIDFDQLPNSFVLKTNHGYGEVLVVKDKNDINLNEVITLMNKYLHTPFGYETAEPHYLRISPCIIAEELLINDSSFSSSLIDYKFYCFNGKPVNCGVYYNRDSITHETYSSFYDMDWNLHPEWQNPMKQTPSMEIPRPQNFDKMKELCIDLCSEFPFVRLDLYESMGKIFFGEFTFTPAAAGGGSLSPDLFKTYGELLKLNQ